MVASTGVVMCIMLCEGFCFCHARTGNWSFGYVRGVVCIQRQHHTQDSAVLCLHSKTASYTRQCCDSFACNDSITHKTVLCLVCTLLVVCCLGLDVGVQSTLCLYEYPNNACTFGVLVSVVVWLVHV